MNGQPTAQNTRECGADGDLPGLPQLGQRRTTSPTSPGCGTSTRSRIPHYAPPTHAMQIFRYAEQGSIRLLWVSGTNPAVSLPELAAHPLDPVPGAAVPRRPGHLPHRDRRSWPTSCCRPPTWGEKTGTFTNADRTVHLSEKAVDPPGEARPDLDIFLDYARRMGLRDKDGAPLVKWRDAEAAFEAWKECSRGPARATTPA